MKDLLDAVQETEILGDYNILKQIGQGSLGTVYIAEHRFLKTQCVLKVFPPELSTDRNFIQRFQEEMGALAALDHPNIVKIHNISFAEGQYFLVTDCIVDEMGETTNLSQYLRAKEKPLQEEEIFLILNQLASALDYAHGKNAVHRGIKLNNILVSNNDGDIHVTLSDFGLSKVIGAGAVICRMLEVVAETLGQKEYSSLQTSFLQNFSFLAPEQKNGDAVDTKADNYAFGVLTYYLIMGRFPEGILEMPSIKRPEFKRDWDNLINSCMQYNPNMRVDLLSPLIEETKKSNTQEYDFFDDKPLRPVIHTAKIERPETDPDPASAFQIDTTVKCYTPEKKEVGEIQPLLTEMAIVEGGTFFRGSNDGNRDEVPRHKVHINSFALDVHPVTNEQFVRFLEMMGGEKDNNYNDIIRLKDSRIKRIGGKLNIESGYTKHPVVGVTWYGAVAYAKWVGKRLPTEAEWEIAASAGKESLRYPTGSEVEKTQANFFSSDTTSVKSYAKSSLGLYDMAGNVYEWVQDWYGYNYYEISIQEPDNPKGPLQGVYRVLRGGCWKSLQEDLRCSRRHRNNPGTVNSTYGFRCATDVQ